MRGFFPFGNWTTLSDCPKWQVNDTDRLGRDPVLRWIVSGRAVAKLAASVSQMGRFETKFLATDDNISALAKLSGAWIDRAHDRRPPTMMVLDRDSSVSPTYGDQEGMAYNGHFGCIGYHPPFLFNHMGDLERYSLRPGNVHSADGWRDVLEPVVERDKERQVRLYFRGDAAFASPDIDEYLEAECIRYAIRLPTNKVLQECITHLLRRPVGRPPKHVQRFHASFSYQAGSWSRKGRVVAKVEWQREKHAWMRPESVEIRPQRQVGSPTPLHCAEKLFMVPKRGLFGYHRGQRWEPSGECRFKHRYNRSVIAWKKLNFWGKLSVSTSRTAFIPWPEAQAGNFKTEYEENHSFRRTTHNKRKWKIIYYDSPGKALAKIGFGVGTRLMIAGHGAIGDPEIAADHGTGGEDLSYVEVVDRLEEKGLPHHYIGTIACDICYSALGRPPFAKLLAKELWSRGYKASCVLGYKGSLYATHSYDASKKGTYEHRTVEYDDGTEVKSKHAQVRFYGWT